MRLIDADALLEAINKIYGSNHAPQGIINLITTAPIVQREEQAKLAGWVSVPDIESLAKEHDVYEVGDYGNTYPISLERLENFAKAYHKAMLSSAPTGSNT